LIQASRKAREDLKDPTKTIPCVPLVVPMAGSAQLQAAYNRPKKSRRMLVWKGTTDRASTVTLVFRGAVPKLKIPKLEEGLTIAAVV